MSDLDSDEQDFFNDGDSDGEYSNEEEREENEMDKSERAEMEARRKRKAVELVPRFDGVFDGLPLSRHPMHSCDRMGFFSLGARNAFLEGREYLRMARTILEEAGLPVPEELLTEAERAATAAKIAREAANAARLAGGVVVRKVRKPPVDGAPVVLGPDGMRPVVASTEAAAKKRQRLPKPAGTPLLANALASHQARPTGSPIGGVPVDEDDVPLVAVLGKVDLNALPAAQRRSKSPDDFGAEQVPRSQPRPASDIPAIASLADLVDMANDQE